MAEQISLTQHLGQLRDRELAQLIAVVAGLSADIRREFPHRLITENAVENKYGEFTRELDDWTNKEFCRALIGSKLVRKVYSEELAEPLLGEPGAPFEVTMDPLDGSSNIVANNPFGSIFGVWRKSLPATGREQVAAFFKLYGPITTLVYTTSETKKVAEFVKARKGVVQYNLLYDGLTIPDEGKVYGVGGNPLDFDEKYGGFLKRLVFGHKLKTRYCGAFVADFSQILHYGGYFGYGGTRKSPNGKLRLFFESNPIALIAEHAGGRSSDGGKSILDVKSDNMEQRVPTHVGNKHIIEELEETLK
ncbi:fructose-1,6-bisphosphatase [Candidatus Micrarchaeota archaeon]|nr:fructose-1,6-bisphosphatase [Candidatus Micrarchaeota archaeon]